MSGHLEVASSARATDTPYNPASFEHFRILRSRTLCDTEPSVGLHCANSTPHDNKLRCRPASNKLHLISCNQRFAGKSAMRRLPRLAGRCRPLHRAFLLHKLKTPSYVGIASASRPEPVAHDASVAVLTKHTRSERFDCLWHIGSAHEQSIRGHVKHEETPHRSTTTNIVMAEQSCVHRHISTSTSKQAPQQEREGRRKGASERPPRERQRGRERQLQQRHTDKVCNRTN